MRLVVGLMVLGLVVTIVVGLMVGLLLTGRLKSGLEGALTTVGVANELGVDVRV